MFNLRVALLFMVCSVTSICWAQQVTDANLISITIRPCVWSAKNVSLYSTYVYTVISDFSSCQPLEINQTMVRSLMDMPTMCRPKGCRAFKLTSFTKRSMSVSVPEK